jgi:2-polyprenyl-6-methoxyphenol hydroxylase-like FAD-dependent oxidoreductase
MSTSDFNVIVVGGGIGGLCLAQALRRAGVGVAVYERDRSHIARLDRYRLHINPAGTRSLHSCLSPEAWRDFVATAGGPGGGFGFLSDRLENLVVVDDEIMYPETTDPAERWYPVDRITLRRLLLGGLDGVVHFDKTFESYEVRPDGRVTAFFADGSAATGDVLVGADGANSRIRRQYLPHAERIDTGALGVGLKLPLTERTRAWLPPRVAVGENIILAPAPFFLFTSVYERDPRAARTLAVDAPAPGQPDGTDSHGDYLLCAFVARRDACPAGMTDLDGADLQRAVVEMTWRWHPNLRRLIAECDPDSVGCFPFLAAAPVAPWESTNVVLLGDAVHSMPPTGGLGANTALRDARLLAHQLTAVARGEKPLLPAVAEYEAEMRDYSYAAVRSSLSTLRQGLVKNAFALAGMRAWFRLSAAVPALKWLGFRDNWAKDARRRPWEHDRP